MQNRTPHQAPRPVGQIARDLDHIIDEARNEAARRHAVYLDVEHLALALLSQPSGAAHDILAQSGADSAALYAQIASEVGIERAAPAKVKHIARASQQALDSAIVVARSLGQSAVNSGHLLVALLESGVGVVGEALAASPLSVTAARDYLRAHPDAGGPLAAQGAPAAPDEIEYVLVPARGARPAKAAPGRSWIDRIGRWPLILLGLAALFVYLIFALPGNDLTTFVIVLVGWIFSLTLHEFSHALVAYWGGDYTVKDKGYLSFNPLKYMHPMLSIGLPLLFLAMGGIGLPGGAVYIERHRLRNKWWGAAVSAAGPLANALLGLVLAAPFLLGKVDARLIYFNLQGAPVPDGGIWTNATLWTAAAFLAMLQVTAVFFNLIPIPPLDGYGVIEPFLDQRTQMQLRQLGSYSLMLIFVALWFIPAVGDSFWSGIFSVTEALKIPGWLINEGFRNFMFWVPR